MSLSSVIADNFGKHLPHVGPVSPSGKLIEFGELAVRRETFEHDGHRIAASMIEPVQGLAGTRIPPKGYLRAVQDLCHNHNTLFVCDEAQTGLGRTGFGLAFQAEDVKPDLVTLGKVYEIAGTYSAFPVAFAAALATLDVLEEEDISERSQQPGELLTKTIDELAPPHVLDHRDLGRGIFQTLVLDESKPGDTARKVGALRPWEVWLSEPVRIGYGSVRRLLFQTMIW